MLLYQECKILTTWAVTALKLHWSLAAINSRQQLICRITGETTVSRFSTWCGRYDENMHPVTVNDDTCIFSLYAELQRVVKTVVFSAAGPFLNWNHDGLRKTSQINTDFLVITRDIYLGIELLIICKCTTNKKTLN